MNVQRRFMYIKASVLNKYYHRVKKTRTLFAFCKRYSAQESNNTIQFKTIIPYKE